jgi:ribose transport system permease protein
MTTPALTAGVRTIRSRHRVLLQILPIYLAAIVLLAIGEGVRSGFASAGNIGSMLLLATFTAILAFGQGVVILVGGFDLSVAWGMTMGGVFLTAEAQGLNSRGAWVVPIVLVAGAAVGLANGLGVAVFDITPIVMTLATGVIVQGLVTTAISGTPTGSAPPFLVALTNDSWGWLPWIVVFLIGFTVLGTVLLRGTRIGRYLHVVGSNRTVARLSGIPVRRTLILAYVLSGVCSALAGMLAAGYTSTSALTTGDSYLLPSIAAVVIGGASVLGGKAHYPATVGGAIFLTILSTILAIANLSDAVRTMLTGVVILLAVLALGQRERAS